MADKGPHQHRVKGDVATVFEHEVADTRRHRDNQERPERREPIGACTILEQQHRSIRRRRHRKPAQVEAKS